jgi:hypothetical protein
VQSIRLVSLEKDAATVRRLLRLYRRSYRQPLVSHGPVGLLQYVRALDRRDWSISFLELWAALEFLPMTQKDPYSVTIRRAATVSGNPKIPRFVLSHLRDVRNGMVHSFQGRPDMEMLVYQTKNYVEWLLAFFLYNPFRLTSLDESRQFLDLPDEIGILKGRARPLRISTVYRTGKPPGAALT